MKKWRSNKIMINTRAAEMMMTGMAANACAFCCAAAAAAAAR
jgi:hypothetical protein